MTIYEPLRAVWGRRMAHCLAVLLIGFVGTERATVAADGLDAEALAATFEKVVAEGDIVGAQLLVGRHDETLLARNFGKLTREGDRQVDADTLFCIGSCSKPFTSACILTLVEEGTLDLDAPIDALLPQFGKLQVDGDGAAERAPTLRELLSHRAGIFSQKVGMTREQAKLIRDFHLTLTESVDGIAAQPLLAPPGERFAYSGAGYCVVGRLAEVAAGKSFEQLLQERLCRPLGIKRVTYFPAADEANIAVGYVRGPSGVRLNREAPHVLHEDLRLPLIGGSIYSTSHETARFARMVLAHGRHASGQIFSPETWNEYTRRQFADAPPYGLGWTLTLPEGSDQAVHVQHNGSLASFRSAIDIDLASGWFVVAHWTEIADLGPANPRSATARLHAAISGAMNGVN